VPLECSPGFYTPEEGMGGCQSCPPGAHCPDLRTSAPRACPPGFLCQAPTTASLSLLEPCPGGFYCPRGSGPYFCPDGTWCPQGTSQIIPEAGNFSTPLRCSDGVRCQAESSTAIATLIEPDRLMQVARARGPAGVSDCSTGSYCTGGISALCPTGHFCGVSAAGAPRLCPPGHFQPSEASSTCSLCPPGTFCFYSG
jgi:hypothetical protein